MSADFVVESSLSNRKQNGMLPEKQHLVQEDQAQDKDDIYERFHVSKKVYKRAVGDLYKKRIFDDMNNGFGWNRLPKSFMSENTVFLLYRILRAVKGAAAGCKVGYTRHTYMLPQKMIEQIKAVSQFFGITESSYLSRLFNG